LQKNLPKFARGVLTPYRRELINRGYRHQTLPIEDIEQIFSFMGSVVRLPCICRQKTHAKEQRYCYGLSLKPDGGEFLKLINGIDKSYVNGPDTSGLETMTKEQTLNNFREYELEGALHAVYTYGEPFIAGICNCDRADCLQMRSQIGNPAKMARGEYVVKADPDVCNGLR
jgi:hypothetical protein